MAEQPKPVAGRPGMPALYVALICSGVMLLGEAYQFLGMYSRNARLGFALLASALCLWLGKGTKLGYASIAIIWLAALLTWWPE